MLKGVVEERSRSTAGGLERSELCGGEVNSFNSRVNSKTISNGNASTVRAAFVQYGLIITHFYDISATPAPLPNREIGPRLIGP